MAQGRGWIVKRKFTVKAVCVCVMMNSLTQNTPDNMETDLAEALIYIQLSIKLYVFGCMYLESGKQFQPH